jgi:predicted nucleotidyltransferase
LNSDNNQDFDFVLRFGDIPLKSYADNYFTLKEELENLLGKKVDLVEEETITNPYFKKEVDATRKKLYG